RVDALAAVQAALAVGVAAGDETAGPAGLLISSVSPNPVLNMASFEVYTASPGMADIAVFDLSGRRVANIGTHEMAEGSNSYSWMVPADITSGIYFVRASVNGSTVTSRMAVIR
ncbi:MAG: T9SS type A sorting domain-containing protein, partial [Candidatus Aegiribacteria sp.]